jgi:benzoyl-CoA 2,3-epoxidase subunit B
LKGRYQEERRSDDHRLHDATMSVPEVTAGRISDREVPALSALNASLRQDYIDDCRNGVDRWNRTLAEVGTELRLPHVGFNRTVGVFAGHRISPDGRLLSEADWEARASDWLPTERDQEHVRSLMAPTYEPGKVAAWIAPPSAGIHNKPLDFAYVRA